MKAIRVHAAGGPEALRYEDIPQPTPEAGQVFVKIEAAGVNFIDVYQRTGQYKVAVPFTPGQEAAGIVVAVGSGVTEPRVGDRVAYTGVVGAYAEFAVVPADRVVALPDGVGTKQGAAAMLQGMTASTPRRGAWACSCASLRSCAAPGSSARSRRVRRQPWPGRRVRTR